MEERGKLVDLIEQLDQRAELKKQAILRKVQRMDMEIDYFLDAPGYIGLLGPEVLKDVKKPEYDLNMKFSTERERDGLTLRLREKCNERLELVRRTLQQMEEKIKVSENYRAVASCNELLKKAVRYSAKMLSMVSHNLGPFPPPVVHPKKTKTKVISHPDSDISGPFPRGYSQNLQPPDPQSARTLKSKRGPDVTPAAPKPKRARPQQTQPQQKKETKPKDPQPSPNQKHTLPQKNDPKPQPQKDKHQNDSKPQPQQPLGKQPLGKGKGVGKTSAKFKYPKPQPQVQA